MKFLIVAVILLNLFTVTLSLKCYVCNSHIDEDCVDPFTTIINGNGTKLVDCTATAPADAEVVLCRKTEVYIDWSHVKDGNMERLHRECGYKLRDGNMDYAKRQEDYELYVYQCDDKDGCNSAPPQSTAFKTALLIVPFVMYRYV